MKDAPDSTAKTASTTLTVTILDADDQKPQFIVPGCTPPCVVPPFEAIIGVNEMVCVHLYTCISFLVSILINGSSLAHNECLIPEYFLHICL